LTEERVLILAPTGRDAEDISAIAVEGGFTPEIVADMAHLCAAIGQGAGVVVLVDSAFPTAEIAALGETLRAQPSWSDLPLVLVAPADVERFEARERMDRIVETLGPTNLAAFVERPILHPGFIIRLAFGLRGRRRQYATHALLEELDLERRRERAVLESLPAGVVVTDAAGRVIETNGALHQIWGPFPRLESIDDVRAFKAWPTGTSHEATPFEWRAASVLATGQPVVAQELEVDAFDGVHRTLLASVHPIPDPRGGRSGVVAVFSSTSPSAQGRNEPGRSCRRRQQRSSSRWIRT
jgi:PAS domain S-box-containing protein